MQKKKKKKKKRLLTHTKKIIASLSSWEPSRHGNHHPSLRTKFRRIHLHREWNRRRGQSIYTEWNNQSTYRMKQSINIQNETINPHTEWNNQSTQNETINPHTEWNNQSTYRMKQSINTEWNNQSGTQNETVGRGQSIWHRMRQR